MSWQAQGHVELKAQGVPEITAKGSIKTEQKPAQKRVDIVMINTRGAAWLSTTAVPCSSSKLETRIGLGSRLRDLETFPIFF